MEGISRIIYRTILLLCVMAGFSSIVSAKDRLHPAPDQSLHYRLIGFSFPEQRKADAYKLEVFEYNAKGEYTRPLLTKRESDNHIIATLPSFGKKYTWHVKYLKKDKVFDSSLRYSFTVAHNPFYNSDTARVQVIDSAKKYKDLLLFFDNTRSLHNMAGEAVWFLPEIKGVSDAPAGKIRDLKLTHDGTITFLTEKNVHEIDYDGNVLWSGPNDGKVSGDTVEQYHHQITKLSNGHYMTIGNKLIDPGTLESGASTNAEAGQGNKLPCGTIIEYEPDNEIAWLWNSCDHLKQGDPTTHFNSFYFDEKNKVVYTSYRNISRVVKAAYPSGKVLALYGHNPGKDDDIKGDDMFYSLHNVGISSDGHLQMFNNSFKMLTATPKENDKRISTVLIMKEPAGPEDSLQKVWEFASNLDTFAIHISSGGGSVYELDKGDYLVCMGLPGRNFIVSANKQVLWNVVTHQKNKEGKWEILAGYRVSPFFPTQLDKVLYYSKK